MPHAVVYAQVMGQARGGRGQHEAGPARRKEGAAIVKAADEALAGKHDREFPLVIWQTGSGTQTNMNVNEVLANRASEILGGERGEKRLVHPERRREHGQSSNDTFRPRCTSARVIALEQTLKPAVRKLRDTLDGRRSSSATS
jgi:fumarate hydratase class II